ncbi:MAG: hypothetical protein KZQ94_01055 [Candidatus Thiodiazotropha sp. (ex Troendleina suluensis)]|nr:hypothetical protein [Candidatus Thiodiazotropha sp. (ex Troendleina suluensis)]
MNGWINNPFEHGNAWVRSDFHLHTKADKEFKYEGKDEEFTSQYVEKLKKSNVRLGAVTNHNKFDKNEFKALRKKAKKEGIGLLPGVELSVKDGANGVHALIVFSDQWLEGGHDYINSFLGSAFHGKVPDQYEQENGRSNDDLITTLRNLEKINRDFFVVFAHVEASSGLWNELKGGRMQELAQEPLVQKYCLGFQKVRTHDKPDAVCRTKVQQWWGEQYPAELEGSDPKSLEEIGRGKSAYLKLGDFSFEAVKYALTDFHYRTTNEIEPVGHSHIRAIRFDGGMLNGKRIEFSPHLNCLIGIRGSGKSSVLESLRYALDIPLGDNAEDQEYKESLLPHVLKSGGKIVVEALDKHGTEYEISRIWKESPDVYVNGELRPGVAIKSTIISKPLYFGQKDLSKAGKGFGQDLVEKLVGEQLKPIRQTITGKEEKLKQAIDSVLALASDTEQKHSYEEELKDVKFQLEHFEKHGVQDKLSKQVEFDNDIMFCGTIDDIAVNLYSDLEEIVAQAEEDSATIEKHESKYNPAFFVKYQKKIEELKKCIQNVRLNVSGVEKVKSDLADLKKELEASKEGLKEEFAEVERELIKELDEQGVKSIQPEDYKTLTLRKAELEQLIADLNKKTAKEKDKQNTLLKALAALNDAWHEEYKVIAESLAQINAAQPALKVEAEFKGDTKAFATMMEQTFRGHNIRKDTYESLAKKYSDYGAIYKDLDNAAKEGKGKSETYKELFSEHLSDLLTFQVPNSFNITYHGKPLKSHSLGQRASAMMLFILSQKENDLLLIDQPEDDLDNQTIYEEVVKLLRDLKPNQQFIFATHNANFPVLGDAELITACLSDEETISVESGSIDHKEAQQKIVDIMEGGPEAFNRRKTIYQLWNSASTSEGSGG